jgi:hypothetical protein
MTELRGLQALHEPESRLRLLTRLLVRPARDVLGHG